jgi:ELWxxDGT repeat protein
MKKNILWLNCAGCFSFWSIRRIDFMKSSFRLLAFLCTFSFGLVALSLSSSAQQIRIVADLNTEETSDWYSARIFSNHVSTGTRSYFTVWHLEREQLWTSDGTPEGTVLLSHFSHIMELGVSGGVLFFTALTDTYGAELWRSDGTVEGTLMLKDIYPGGGSSTPSYFTDVDGVLYFSANNQAEGRELWKSDGTPDGTQMVKDVKPGAESSNVAKIVRFNTGVLFVADDGSTGHELWRSDGSASGTTLVNDIFPMTTSSAPDDLTVVNGVAYFSARSPVYDRQLFRSDGTATGTWLVKVIRAGGLNANIDKITAVNNIVFFEALDGLHGAELWKSDGSAEGTMLVKDITPGAGSNEPEDGDHIEHPANVNGKLFFIATAQDSRNVWVSDGTPDGTKVVEGSDEFSFSALDPGFVSINGEAYFIAVGPLDIDVSLVKSDGNSTTLVKADFAPPARPPSTPIPAVAAVPEFIEVNGQYHFFTGNEYWKTDGTSDGTVMIKDLAIKGGVAPQRLADLNGTLLFGLENTFDAPWGFWKTNGTPETTSKLGEISVHDAIVTYNGLAYFGGSISVGMVPFRSDGTVEGTFALSNEIEWPVFFTPSNGVVFFQAGGPQGYELYKTNGTPEGTVLVKDIYPGGWSNPYGLTDVSNTLFFNAATSEYGRELWKSDGTADGTMLVKDISPGPAETSFSNVNASYMGHLFFNANDGASGFELWKSDGTPEGTVMMSDLRTADVEDYDMGEITTSSQFVFFTALNNEGKVSLWRSTLSTVTELKAFGTTSLFQLHFLGADGEKVYMLLQNGVDTELWRTDGTPTGTWRVHRFRNAVYEHKTAAFRNGIFYFGLAGTVWRSDGTPPGTYSLPFSGPTRQFTTSGDYVYFNGTSMEHGSELYLIEEESTSAASESISVAREPVSSFPNPFRSTITLHVLGPQNEKFTVSVINANGQPVSEETLSYNVDHALGSYWKSGIYFFQIREGNRVTMKKVIKIED